MPQPVTLKKLKLNSSMKTYIWREQGKALEMLYSGKKAPGAGTEHESLCWLVFLAVAWSSTEGA